MSSFASWGVAFSSMLEPGFADISAEINALHAYFAQNGIRGGWRKVGSILGISGAYAREIALRKKPIGRDLAEHWLSITGRYRQMYEIPECPDCGDYPHVIRCHNKPVAQVVILSPDERVYRRKPAQRWADMPVAELKRAIENRQPYRGRM